jgi:hypothetical protein
MQKYSDHSFDKQIRQSFEKLPDLPSDQVWKALVPEVERISAQIKEQKRSKKQGLFLFLGCVVLCALLFLVRTKQQALDGANRMEQNQSDALSSHSAISALPTAPLPNPLPTNTSKNGGEPSFAGAQKLANPNALENNLPIGHSGISAFSQKPMPSSAGGTTAASIATTRFWANHAAPIAGTVEQTMPIAPKLSTHASTISDEKPVHTASLLAKLPSKPALLVVNTPIHANLSQLGYGFENPPNTSDKRLVKRAIRLGMSTNFQSVAGTALDRNDYVFEKATIQPLYQLAMPFEMKLRGQWFLQPELNLTAKGLRYLSIIPLAKPDHLTLLYAELPLMLKYKMPLGRHNLSWMAGPSIGSPFFLYGKDSGKKVFEVGLGFGLPVDFGLNAGAELRYKIKKGELLLDLRYQKTLTRVYYLDNGQKVSRQSLTLGLGWSKTIRSEGNSLIKPFNAFQENKPINRSGIVAHWLTPFSSTRSKGLTRRLGFATESALNQKWGLFAGIQHEKSHYKVDLERLTLDKRTKVLEKYKFVYAPMFADTARELNNQWTQLNFPVGLTHRFGQKMVRTQWFARAVITPLLQGRHTVDYNKISFDSKKDQQRNVRLGACGLTMGMDYKIAQNLIGQIALTTEVTPFRNEVDGLRHAFLGLNTSLWWGR